MKSNNERRAGPLPPEFLLPHEAAVPDSPEQADRGVSDDEVTDAAIVSGVIELADKEEYVDEP